MLFHVDNSYQFIFLLLTEFYEHVLNNFINIIIVIFHHKWHKTRLSTYQQAYYNLLNKLIC